MVMDLDACSFFPAFLLLLAVIISCTLASASNPAEELAALLNKNRTDAKQGALVENEGLGCIALQYVHEFQQECNLVSTQRPPDNLINTTYARNCGIEPSTIPVPPLAGALVYCQSSYVSASDAFPLLVPSSNALAKLHSPNYTQFGVAVGSYAGGSPYYWAALFSDALSNSSFLLATGKTLPQKEGCFSGTTLPCNATPRRLTPPLYSFLFIFSISMLLASNL